MLTVFGLLQVKQKSIKAVSANHLSVLQTLGSVFQTSHPCGKCLGEADKERGALSFQIIVSEASIRHVGEAVVD